VDDTFDSNSMRQPRAFGSRYARLDRRSPVEPATQTSARAIEASAQNWQIDAQKLLRWLRAGLPVIAGTAVLGAGLGLAFALVTPPRYTAMSEILLDPTGLQVINDDLYSQNSAQDAQLLEAESKLKVLTSGNVLNRVVATLNLGQDPEFVPPGKAVAGADPAIIAERTLEKRISARREDRSFVVTLGVWSQVPEKAATISTTIISAFQDELVAADAEGAGKTAAALNDRLAQLRTDVRTAESAVETFKRAHGLQSSDGELISGRSMTQLTTQMLDAQQQQIQAEPKYLGLTRGPDANKVVDAQQSATLTDLRNQYAVAKQEYDAQAQILGPLHPTRIKLKGQVDALQAQIKAEQQRLVNASKAELQQATSVAQALAAKSADLRADVSSDDQAQVQLRELERDATSKAAIYEAFLSRATQLTERQKLDTNNIRIITPPVVPDSRSWPPPAMQTTIAGFGGGLAGGALFAVLLGGWADMRRRRKEGVR